MLSDEDEMNVSLQPTEFSMFNSVHGESTKETDLRKIYIQNYGVKMEFPAYYIQDAKFVPHEPDLIVQMA